MQDRLEVDEDAILVQGAVDDLERLCGEGLLDLFERMITHDRAYHERLERHYEMWKRVVDDPGHPDHHKVRTAAHDDPDFEPARRAGPRVGRNDPCPCGSGRKYKRCCLA